MTQPENLFTAPYDVVVAYFRDPGCWPSELRPFARDVDVVQTHLSVVVLCGGSVFKLKRPVNLPFCGDLRSAERRAALCADEVRINRRMAREVYRGVVWLHHHDGRWNFAGVGAPVEPAVHMARLPQDRMLDVLLGDPGGVRPSELEAFGHRIGQFHGSLIAGHDGHRPEVAEAADPRKLQDFANANFVELRSSGSPAGDAASGALLDALEARSAVDFERFLPALHARATASGMGRRILEGHGDLHARNVCMTDPPIAYDALEFSLDLRALDVATELAFLTMDLRYRGHAALVSPFLEGWRDGFAEHELRDDQLGDLLPVLEGYRALVRAKVSALLVGDPTATDASRHHAAESFVRHLRVAACTAIEDSGSERPHWVVVCGVPATGKSTLCRELQRASGFAWPRFATDPIRKELAGLTDATERLDDQFYDRDFSDRTYAEVLRRAAATAAPVLLIDGNYVRRIRRDAVRRAAEQRGARVSFVWLTVEEDEAIRRLEARTASGHSESDAGVAVWRAVVSSVDAPGADEPLYAVATDERGAVVDRVLELLLRGLAIV